MIQFLKTKALVFVSSLCISDKDILKIRLLNPKVVDKDLPAHEELQNLGQAFAVVIDLNAAKGIAHLNLIGPLKATESLCLDGSVEGDGNGVAQPQFILQVLGLAHGLDPSVLDESDPLA
jgi:hypothetical protein